MKKFSFSVFTERVSGCVIVNLKHGSDIEQCVRKLEDPFEDFISEYKPTPLVEAEPSFDVRFEQQERIKAYISR